jgi:hypothetical protein
MADPLRDRRLASKPRYAYRRADDLGSELTRLRQSPEFAAMRRFARIHGALAEVLPEAIRGKVKAIAERAGTVTLEVSDGVLLAELRSTRARDILNALAAAGTGASRLVWRVARRR